MSQYPSALRRLAEWPRTPLVREPTPLLEAGNLTRELGLTTPLLVKMDAETGFAMGGNKTRKLEFELAPDRIEEATHVVTCGNVHSNHCRQTAAAAARLGLPCVLVLSGDPPEPPTGNALLHRLLGADIRKVDATDEREAGMSAAAEEIRDAGGRPLVVPLGASTPLGCLGYARAAVEFDRQCAPDGRPLRIFVSASSCGTYAGLVLGFVLLGRTDVTVVGVSPDVTEEEIRNTSATLLAGAARLLELEDSPVPERWACTADFVGEGYGIPTEASLRAAERFATREGIFLEHAYTAKTAAALLAEAEGRPEAAVRRVLWHTGGYPSVFRTP